MQKETKEKIRHRIAFDKVKHFRQLIPSEQGYLKLFFSMDLSCLMKISEFWNDTYFEGYNSVFPWKGYKDGVIAFVSDEDYAGNQSLAGVDEEPNPMGWHSVLVRERTIEFRFFEGREQDPSRASVILSDIELLTQILINPDFQIYRWEIYDSKDPKWISKLAGVDSQSLIESLSMKEYLELRISEC